MTDHFIVKQDTDTYRYAIYVNNEKQSRYSVHVKVIYASERERELKKGKRGKSLNSFSSVIYGVCISLQFCACLFRHQYVWRLSSPWVLYIFVFTTFFRIDKNIQRFT